MMWLTHYDAEIVGSNAPFVIDEADLERRIAEPAVAGDLKRVMMGSADRPPELLRDGHGGDEAVRPERRS